MDDLKTVYQPAYQNVYASNGKSKVVFNNAYGNGVKEGKLTSKMFSKRSSLPGAPTPKMTSREKRRFGDTASNANIFYDSKGN